MNLVSDNVLSGKTIRKRVKTVKNGQIGLLKLPTLYNFQTNQFCRIYLQLIAVPLLVFLFLFLGGTFFETDDALFIAVVHPFFPAAAKESVNLRILNRKLF